MEYKSTDPHSEKTEQLINELFDELNKMGNEPSVARAMYKAISKNHRTLQQNFWRCMKDVIELYSENRFDDRNEGAVKMCGIITEELKSKEIYLPFI